jgi:hypothetical protein
VYDRGVRKSASKLKPAKPPSVAQVAFAASATLRGLGRLPTRTVLVPDPDVFRISGAGRALVSRQRPDGQLAWGSVSFDLKRPEELIVFGDVAADEGSFEQILHALTSIDGCAPMVAGNASLAGRFAWGARAFARARGVDFDEEPPYLALFPRPGTTERELRAWFDGPRDGICDSEMLELCRREEEADLPRGEALITLVAMGFRLVEPALLAAALEADEAFEPRASRGLDWCPDGGDACGSVEIAGRRLRADAISLDHAGRLCATLKRIAGPGTIELAALERRTLPRLLKERALEAG